MKKVFLALAVIVMAFGNAKLFAQRSERLAMIQKQVVEKCRGSRDNSWYAPATATFTEIDGGYTFRSTYTYDEYEYYLTEKLVEVKIGNVWKKFECFTYEYDFIGNPVEMLVLVSDDGNTWTNAAYETYSYDGEGMLSEVITQYWDNGAWQNDDKMVYNFNGMDYTIITYDWDGVWRTDELYTITYDLSGNYEVLVQYMQGGAWQNDVKFTYALNDFYLLEQVLEQDWVNNAWQNDELETYNYNGGLVSSIDIQEWMYGAWANEAKVNYNYQNGNATYAIYQKWNGSQWVNADGDIEVFYSDNANSELFEDVHEVNVQYVDLTSVDENKVMNYSVCPNPASESLIVNGEGFVKAEIYNIAGQKVMESSINTINVSNLQSGIYMLKVYDVEGRIEAQSIVVK